MTDNNTENRQHRDISRRSVLRTGTLLATLSAVGTTSGRTIAELTDDNITADSHERSTPAATAQAYVAALDADDRETANELIAKNGELDTWDRAAFSWVGAFDFEFVEFRPVEEDEQTVTGELKLTIDGNEGALWYRFREIDSEGWKLWESVDGLRFETEGAASAEEAARSYVGALDEGDREAVNDLIANGGELEPWGSREFDWVGAFEFEFEEFRSVSTTDREATGEIDMRVGGNERTVRYRFRELDDEGWKLWDTTGGIRD